ncbi:MAG: hypothetical protein IIA02_10510 [Proteobacteria bacterium]|nr:hypothetical protein [Pseudomonadota bacterium]
MSTTKFHADTEAVTSVTHLSIHHGEAVSGPIVTGFYPGSAGEIWIDQEGARINIPAEHFKAVMAQLKRTHDIAKESSSD